MEARRCERGAGRHFVQSRGRRGRGGRVLVNLRSRRSPSTAVLLCLPLFISRSFGTDSGKSPSSSSGENDEKSDLSRILSLFCRCVSLLCRVSILVSRASRPPGTRDIRFLPPLRSGASGELPGLRGGTAGASALRLLAFRLGAVLGDEACRWSRTGRIGLRVAWQHVLLFLGD